MLDLGERKGKIPTKKSPRFIFSLQADQSTDILSKYFKTEP